MADGKSDDWFKLPAVGIVAIVAAVAGHIWKMPAPYTDERPASNMVAEKMQAAPQDIDARLWQDPFSAKPETKTTPTVAAAVIGIAPATPGGHLAGVRLYETTPTAPKHDHSQIYLRSSPTCYLTVMVALLPGGRYAEDIETRQRQRYAVLSALAARGFVPADAEHLGYFDLGPPQPGSSPGNRVWFEWFETPEVDPSCSACNGRSGARSKVLVLWVNDAALGSKPLKGILDILQQVSPGANGHWPLQKVRYAVIGPNQSKQLAVLAGEALSGKLPDSGRRDRIAAGDVDFFPAMATAADHVLLGENASRCKALGFVECMRKAGIRLFRTTPNDEVLSGALVAELKLRRVTPQSGRVVLLSDWDSLYGRELPKTFAEAFSPREPGRVQHVSYERGLDGRLPGKSDKSDASAERPKSEERKPDPRAIERPEGQSQKDYLRRLVEVISENEPAKNDIRAIGVLGYDLYDKLLILQALRERFPGKIFFTTDLDAAYSHPSELPYTRNLIVASGFDLRLRPELQRDIPPFRDSQQTAVFYSTLLAMQDMSAATKQDYPLNPLVFEIGRDRRVPLSLTDFKFGNESAGCNPDALRYCGNFHPPLPKRWPPQHFLLLAAVLAIAVILASRMSWTVRDALEYKIPGRLRMPVMLPAVIIPSGLIIAAGYCPYVPGHEGEAFYWTAGVSIWPSELLRGVACVMALLLLWKAWHVIKTDTIGYIAEFRLEPGATPKWTSAPSAVNAWKPFAAEGNQVNLTHVLAEYHALGDWRARGWRSAVNSFWFLLAGTVLIALWGGPHVPARGEAAFITHFAVIVCTLIAVTFLAAWIVDAARLCQRMIRHLSQGPSEWPVATVEKFQKETGLGKDDGIAEWIDITFIARHTSAIQQLIWYPVVPLLLVILARHSIFDAWDFPPALIVTLALILGYAFSSVFHLQSCAKAARDKALGNLTSHLEHMRDQPWDARKIEKTEQLRSKVAALKQGAFQPLLEQPILKALLALLGGGGLALTDLMGLFN